MGGASVACQTYPFQEKTYTNKGNKGDSSQEKGEYKEGVLLGLILMMAGWRHIEKQGKYWRGPKETEKLL